MQELSKRKQESDVGIRPFHSGSEFYYWESSNCSKCSKSFANMQKQNTSGEGPCDLDNALTVACVGTGKIPMDIALRLGYAEDKIERSCPEFASLIQKLPEVPPYVRKQKQL